MKQLNIILIFIILSSLFSCGPTATFKEPQPANTNNLLKFQKQIQGKFQSMMDNSLLTITDKSIIRIYDFDFREHINQIDSNYRLVDDTLINIKDNEKTLIKKDGDSIVFHIHTIDTSFSISDNNILKKFKGYYFLNFKYKENNWEVKKLELHHGKLSISSISTQNEIVLLKTISENTIDSLTYKFKPTKKQFKKFIKASGFSNTESFIKIK